MRRWVFAISALAVVGAAALPAIAQDGQPMFRGGPQLTGVYGAQTPRRLEGVRFRFDAGAPLRNAPALAGGKLYVGAADGAFYALDAGTGTLTWRAAVGSPVTSSAAVSNGQILFTTRDNTLHALIASNGREAWSIPLGADLGAQNYWDFYNSSPVLFDDTIYVGSGDGGVYAIDPRTQHRIWRANIGARVRSTPAVSQSVVVVGAQDGYVYGIDRRSGRVRWRFATDGAHHTFELKHNDTTSVFASPTIAGGIVAVGGRDGQLYALDLATGAKRWQTTEDGGSWILSTASEDGALYVGGGSASIVQSLDMASGHERWRASTDSAVFGSPSISGQALVVSDFGGVVRAVDRGDGHELWQFAMGDRSFSTPVLAGGVVYASSDAGVLYALETTETPGPARVKQYVFAAGPGPNGETWFPNNIDQAIVGVFNARHYQSLDGPALVAAMTAQIEQGGRSVIVFADNNIPARLREGENAQCLLRRYLEAGGAVVFLSFNPASFRYDEHGAVNRIDESLSAAMLDLHYAPHPSDYGYHVSRPTPQGLRWGLPGDYVVNGSIPADQVTTVLGTDEFGFATTWTRRYGNGGLLIQLGVAQNRLSDLTPDINVIALALANGGG